MIDLTTGRLFACTTEGKEMFSETPVMNFWSEKAVSDRPDALLLQWKNAAQYAYLSEEKEPSVRKHKDHISAAFEYCLPVMPAGRCTVVYRFFAYGRIEVSMEMDKNEEGSLPPEFGMVGVLSANSSISVSSYYQEENKKLRYTYIIKR